MKVKNGTASSRSFDSTLPNTRPRDRLQVGEGEEAVIDRDEAEGDAESGERERHRIADQHEQHEAAEHQRRHHVQGDHPACLHSHCVGLSYLASIST